MEPEAHPQPEQWRDGNSAALEGIDDLELMFDAACDAIDRMRAQVRAELGLSAVECLVVRLLTRQALSIGELARRTGVGRSSISMAAGRLEKRGMIVRTARSRRAALELTEPVRLRYHDACRAPARAALADWSIEQPAGSVDAATDLLTRIGAHVEQARDSRRTRDAITQLHDALLGGDARACFDTARGLMVDGATEPAYTAILHALDRIETRRSRQKDAAADDHTALLTATQATDRLHRLCRNGRRAHRSALVAPVRAGDADLGTRMAAYELERAGWDVHLAPGALSEDAIRSLAGHLYPDVIVLGVPDAAAVPSAVGLARDLAPDIAVAAFGTVLQSEVLSSRFDQTCAPVRGSLELLASRIDDELPPVDHRAA